MKSEREVVIDELHQIACELNALPKASEIKPLADRMFRAIAKLSASVPGEAVAWALCRKRDGFIRGCYSTEPTADQLEFAELDGDEYRALYTHPAVSASVVTEASELARKVLDWAESKCPCSNELPDPCTLCGESVATGTCKAAQSVLPDALYAALTAALGERK